MLTRGILIITTIVCCISSIDRGNSSATLIKLYVFPPTFHRSVHYFFFFFFKAYINRLNKMKKKGYLV